MHQIKQASTDPLIFFMADAADHVTGKTGLTPTVTLSKAGSALIAPAGVVSEIGAGLYQLLPTAADTDTPGMLSLVATAVDADQATMAYSVVTTTPADVLAAVAALNDLSLLDLATALDTLNDLSAAEIRTALGMAAADLDAQLDALANDPLSVEAIADAVVDEVLDGDIDGPRTLRNLLSAAAPQTPAVVPDPAPDEETAVVFINVEDLTNVVVAGIVITFRLIGGPAKTERMLSSGSAALTTDDTGNGQIILQRNDKISPSGTYYMVNSPELGLYNKKLVLDAAIYDLRNLVS